MINYRGMIPYSLLYYLLKIMSSCGKISTTHDTIDLQVFKYFLNHFHENQLASKFYALIKVGKQNMIAQSWTHEDYMTI